MKFIQICYLLIILIGFHSWIISHTIYLNHHQPKVIFQIKTEFQIKFLDLLWISKYQSTIWIIIENHFLTISTPGSFRDFLIYYFVQQFLIWSWLVLKHWRVIWLIFWCCCSQVISIGSLFRETRRITMWWKSVIIVIHSFNLSLLSFNSLRSSLPSIISSFPHLLHHSIRHILYLCWKGLFFWLKLFWIELLFKYLSFSSEFTLFVIFEFICEYQWSWVFWFIFSFETHLPIIISMRWTKIDCHAEFNFDHILV